MNLGNTTLGIVKKLVEDGLLPARTGAEGTVFAAAVANAGTANA